MSAPRTLWPFQAILLGGFAAGTLDILYAFLFHGLRNGISPLRILQSIASGLLGAASREGGFVTGALGLALHFFIACAAAAVFYGSSRLFPFLKRQAVSSGLLFGVGVYLVMNFVVVPLSRFPYERSFAPEVWVSGLLIHMFGIGLPIALAVRRTPD